MGVFQATTGYRAPAKSLTIKALESRLKQAQETAANATQMKDPIASPWQGAAYLGNILAGQAGAARAESADIHARDELAKIKSGIDWSKGMTSEQYAEFSKLDPEGADKIMQDWVDYRQEMDKQAKQNEYTTRERIGGQEFETTREEDAQEHAITLATKNQELDTEEEKRKELREDDKIKRETQAREEEWKRLNPNGDINSPEAQAFILRNSSPVTAPFGGPQGQETMRKWKTQINAIDSGLNNLQRAEELLKSGNVAEGTIDKTLMDALMMGGAPGRWAAKTAGWSDAQIAATQEYYQIMGLNAASVMAETLSGADSDRDVIRFQKYLADPDSTLSVKLNTIARLRPLMEFNRSVFTDSLAKSGGGDTPAWTYRPPVGSAPAAPAAPAANPNRKPISELSDEELKNLG